MNNLTSIGKKSPAWTREFDSLIRAIGECKSKAEEDSIMTQEVETLKPRLKDPKLDKRFLKELLIRLIYIEMLGHDASWGHVKALQACSETNLITKKASMLMLSTSPVLLHLFTWLEHRCLCVPRRARSLHASGLLASFPRCIVSHGIELHMQVAYLASSLFLDYRSDMIILVVNTLTTDLKSDNFLVGELENCQSAHYSIVATVVTLKEVKEIIHSKVPQPGFKHIQKPILGSTPLENMISFNSAVGRGVLRLNIGIDLAHDRSQP